MKLGVSFRSLLLIFVILTCIDESYSQGCNQNEIDSLIRTIDKESIKITDKIDSWNKLSICYTYFDLDSASYFAGLAQKKAFEIDYKKGMAHSTYNLANVENKNGNKNKSLILADQTIDLYNGLEKDLNYFNTINIAGIIYELQHNYDKALEYYFLGLRDAELLDFKLDAGFFYNNISIIYSYTGDKKLELEYVRKASEIFHELGEDFYYSYTLINIGAYFIKEEKTDSARKYFIEAEPILIRDDNYYGLTNMYSILGEMELESNADDSAIEYFHKSLRSAELIDSSNSDRLNRIASIHIKIGNFQLKKQSYNIAIKHFNVALDIGKQYNSLLHQQLSSEGLLQCFLYLNKQDSAMYYYHLSVSYNDSLLAETYNERIDQLNYDYQLEKEKELFDKEMELIYLQKNRQELIYLTLVGLLLAVSLIVFFIWRLQKVRLQKSELMSQNLNLENENMSFALERKNKELTTTVLNLVERNEFIARISEKLSGISNGDHKANFEDIEEVVRSIDKDSANNLWKEFEKRYMDVHQDFHKTLTSQFPNLTANERKLCAFIMLNMSTKDISSITYQSIHSIKIARYRLRKKMGLEKNESLTTFLHNL